MNVPGGVYNPDIEEMKYNEALDYTAKSRE